MTIRETILSFKDEKIIGNLLFTSVKKPYKASHRQATAPKLLLSKIKAANLNSSGVEDSITLQVKA